MYRDRRFFLNPTVFKFVLKQNDFRLVLVNLSSGLKI